MSNRTIPKTYIIPFTNYPNCRLLEYIRQGIKQVEGRKNSPLYQDIKVGDYIIFRAKNERDLKVVVTYIRQYRTLTDYLKGETIARTMPCAKNIEQAKAIYNKWTSHHEREILREKYGFGFLGIGFALVQ